MSEILQRMVKDGEVMQVTIKSTDRPGGHQAGLFTALLTLNDPETADVNLILQDKSVIQTHRIKLGVSPVLKTVLTSLDVRMDSRPHISLQDFETQAVISLLSFIYKGEVVMVEKSRSMNEFMKLCKTLKLNPSVTKEKSSAEEGSRDKAGSNEEPRTETNNEELEDGESVVVSEDDHEDLVCPLVEDEAEEPSDVICDIEPRLDMEDDDDLPSDEPVIPLQPIYSNSQEDSEEESTEHISDYLNSILHNNNTTSQEDTNSQENPPEVSEEEEDLGYTPFKMPDSFDIPQEYIQEMVPQAAPASGVTVPFQTSDEEPDTPEIPMLLNNEPKEIVEPPKDEGKDEEKVETKVESTGETKVEDTGLSPKEDSPDSTDVVEDTINSNEIVQTYTRKEGSIRQRDHKKSKNKKTHHPKMDRRTLQAKLFGESDSEEELKKGSVKKKDDFKKEKTLSDSSDSEEESARTPTPTSVLSDLEDKKRRMKKAIKKSEAEDKKAKNKKKTVEHRAIQKATKSSTSSKDHVCNSSCACVRKKALDEDETWLVPDNEVVYDTTDSDPPPQVAGAGKKTKPKRVNIGDSSTEDGENDTDHTEFGKKRMAERKVALALRGGDQVLNKLKGRVTVSIQNTPRGIVVDKWQYQAMLDASDSAESEPESKKQTVVGDSDSDSEVPRGKRVSPIKSLEEERERERERRQEKRKKKKLKKLKIVSPRVTDFPVEEVEVWTPAMYEKWDKCGRPKKRKHRHDSDSDSKQKSKKPGFNRSMSFGSNKTSDQQKMLQRSASSMSTLESLGITLGTSIAKPVSSLPKIPKLKKPENL